jgi:hypothetical protein
MLGNDRETLGAARSEYRNRADAGLSTQHPSDLQLPTCRARRVVRPPVVETADPEYRVLMNAGKAPPACTAPIRNPQTSEAGVGVPRGSDPQRADSRDGQIASSDSVWLQAPALKAAVGRRSPAWPSDLRSCPIPSVRLPRSARSLSPSRRLASHDRVGDKALVPALRARGRCLRAITGPAEWPSGPLL